MHLSIGPDGAIYVLDFYREVIETPLSLPADIQKQLNLESRGRGRIWRIVPKDFKPTKLPDFTALSLTELVAELTSLNPWRRNTAQRLLVERQEKAAAAQVRGLLSLTLGKPGRVNLLWTLEGLGELTAADVLPALDDREPGVRENALRLAEPFFSKSPELVAKALGMPGDPSARVRFQLALSAGSLPLFGNRTEPRRDVLTQLLDRDRGDPWIVTAALTSTESVRSDLIQTLRAGKTTANLPVLSRLAAMVGASGKKPEIVQLLTTIAAGNRASDAEDTALLEGLGQGMRNSAMSLAAMWYNPMLNAAEPLKSLRKRFVSAAAVLNDEKSTAGDKIAAAGLLAYGPFNVAGPALAAVLKPTAPGDLQLTAVRALAAHNEAGVSANLLQGWKGYGPALRAAVLDVMIARPERVLDLLDAVQKKQFAAADLSTGQIQQIKAHPNDRVKARAAEVLKLAVDPDRAKVIADYTPALELKGDAAMGKIVFQKHCAACHKLDGVGHDVGPNLLATIGNKSGADLLVAVFDPNREVDPRYLSYVAGTADGQTLTGIIVSETPTSITMRRSEGAEDVILRANLEFLRSTSLSLMPVGLEKELKVQEVADLFAYLRRAGR